jgi:3-phenylpropionate/trans-cinnamate dioxygenase ferredoxin component
MTLKFSELADGKAMKIAVNGKAVCVVRLGNEVVAVADTCTHSEASLSEGDISNGRIECWLHGAEFDLRTGKALTPPATEDLEVFSVAINGDEVVVSETAGKFNEGVK